MDWIGAGRRPDFFCPGVQPLIVEVKTFDPPAEQQLMTRAFEDLAERCAQEVGLTGDIYVTVGNAYGQDAAAWLIRYLRRAVLATAGTHVAAVPVDVVSGDVQVTAAAFGDLQIPVGGTIADAVYGSGAAWTANKNRGVSALRYICSPDSATVVINPWADYQIDPGVFVEQPWTMINRRPARR